MEYLLEIFTKPEFLAAVGPFGILFLVAMWGIYKLFKKYDEVQEKRIAEAQAMQKEYYDLAKDVDKTLEILLVTLGKKNNGTGH